MVEVVQQFEVRFEDSGRSAQCPPNPAYPTGIDVDGSCGAAKSCTVAIPYPSPRCGLQVISCRACGLTVAITVAGRVDDPRSIKLACEPMPTGRKAN